ncbi:MAG: methylated-DNA--[protein]-cysteine S-methyltransferase [Propionibacteriaceae bacterium]|jgi:methylated-DNA-[protein]-cysteine S-methyltransferase|nr:methylated-DNA--[protein]-cysteine S-methyltransferase [Propionibacteriaceae bacterium]
MSQLKHCEYDTPGGTLSIVYDPNEQVVVAAGFFGFAPLWERLAYDSATLAKLRVSPPDAAPPKWLAEPLAAYCAGDIAAIGKVPVRQPGPPFRQAVWQVLRKQHAPLTYGELAALTVATMGGSPGAPAARLARAVGSAMSHNLIALFVPCHRVVPASGGVGAYGFGPHIKAALLDFEKTASV